RRGHYGGVDRKRLPPRPATTGSVGRLFPTRKLVEFTSTLKGNKMKSFITTIVATAAITWPGAVSVRSQEPPASPTPAALASFEQDEQELERTLAEVQQQVEVELTPKLEAVAAQAGAKVQEAQRRIDQQLAEAQEAIELAQAAAPVAPVAPPGGGGGGRSGDHASAFQDRL